MCVCVCLFAYIKMGKIKSFLKDGYLWGGKESGKNKVEATEIEIRFLKNIIAFVNLSLESW